MLFTNRFAKQHGVHIEERFADELPRVHGDPDQLKQVFLNLVTNAVQAMGDGGGLIDHRDQVRGRLRRGLGDR